MRMRRKSWLFLFALALVGYGLSQYWSEQRGPEFAATLLQLDTTELEAVRVAPPQGEAFRLVRLGDRWLLSREHVHVTARPSSVAALLKGLQHIETTAIVTREPTEWPDYGLDDKQGLALELTFRDGGAERLVIGRFQMNPERESVEAFARLPGQREVFAVKGWSLTGIDPDFDHYRSNQLLKLDSPPDQFILRLRDTTHRFRYDSLGWWRDGRLLPDSLGSDPAQWQRLNPLAFADDFDELSATDHRLARLVFPLANDSITLDVFQDTTRETPFVLHSSQFPDHWLAEDSTGWYYRQVHPLR